MGGIYWIKNIKNNKVYIGSTYNFMKRKNEHFRKLKLNKHHSILLQRSYNKHEKEDFIFEIIEILEDLNKLIEREQYWLDLFESYDKNKGYNLSEIAGSNLGMKFSNETRTKMSKSRIGIKLSEETKRKISDANKGKILTEECKQKISKSRTGKYIKENNAFYGKHHSEETKEKISILRTTSEVSLGENNPFSILTEEQVFEIKKLIIESGLNNIEIANLFNVSISTISHIKNGRIWSHIMPESIKIKSRASLTLEQVIEIKKILRDTKLSCVKIGNIFNVGRSAIEKIKNNKTWKHVKLEDYI